MTFDEYDQAITSIHHQLTEIARRTANQAMVGSADTLNPEFIALMQRHTQLIKLSTELTERMVARIQTNR